MTNEAQDKNETLPAAGPFVVPDVSEAPQHIEASINPVHEVQKSLNEAASDAAVVGAEALHLKPENIISHEQFEAKKEEEVGDASRWEAETEIFKLDKAKKELGEELGNAA